MVITLKNQPTVSPEMARTVRQPLRPRFQGGAGTAGKELVSEIKNIGTADSLYKKFGRMQVDLKIGGLSINDWASRVNTALAVYLPALYFSLVPEKKHFWETNGRNVLIWFATLGVALGTKHPKIGANGLFNHLMPQKKNLKLADATGFGDKLGRLWQKGLDKLRPSYDYYDLLYKAGVLTEKEMKTARNKLDNQWASLDNNQIERLKMKVDQISKELEKPLENRQLEGMTRKDAEKFLKDAPNLMNRLSSMKIASLLANTGATVYLVGILAMDIVFKYIAPKDPDFDASKLTKYKKKSDKKQSTPDTSTVTTPKPTGTPTGTPNVTPQAPVSFWPNPQSGTLPGAFMPGQPMAAARPLNLPWPPNPALQGGRN